MQREVGGAQGWGRHRETIREGKWGALGGGHCQAEQSLEMSPRGDQSSFLRSSRSSRPPSGLEGTPDGRAKGMGDSTTRAQRQRDSSGPWSFGSAPLPVARAIRGQFIAGQLMKDGVATVGQAWGESVDRGATGLSWHLHLAVRVCCVCVSLCMCVCAHILMVVSGEP